MADLQSIVDRIFYANRREYTHVEGEVAYLDGTPLRRPLSMPRAQKVVAAAIVVVAVVIGALFVNDTVLASAREAANAEQSIADNLARPASLETIPSMAELINLGDDDIRARFAEAGFTVYDATEEGDSEAMVLYKLPDDVEVADAALMYAQGVGSLSAVQATKLLNGSWSFSAGREGVTSMVVRYADFTTGDPQTALEAAIAKEGFDPESVTDSGEDDSGNTYAIGSLDADGTGCTWQVSALPLFDVYSVKNLPEQACYVGIRLTVNAE